MLFCIFLLQYSYYKYNIYIYIYTTDIYKILHYNLEINSQHFYNKYQIDLKSILIVINNNNTNHFSIQELFPKFFNFVFMHTYNNFTFERTIKFKVIMKQLHNTKARLQFCVLKF